MTRSTASLLLVLGSTLPGAAAAARQRPAPTPPPVLVAGDVVPPFEAEGLDGVSRKIEFPDGTATVLLFFMGSCPSCHKMIPEWSREYDERADGVQVVGVLMDRPPPGYFMSVPMTFPVVLSPGRTLMREGYKVYRVPMTLRVGPGGVVEDAARGRIDGIRLGELFRAP